MVPLSDPIHVVRLGRSGLRLDALTLGTMTFGEGDWRAGAERSAELFHRYRESGGSTFDTADVYGDGASERLLGNLIAQARCRDDVVIATKGSAPSGARGPNSEGNGRAHLMRALNGSLRRLGTDHVDLYWLHLWDRVTPVEEVVRTLDEMVRSGKARAVGLSNVPAWYAASAWWIARDTHAETPAAVQLEYSLLERTCELELVPVAVELGISIVVWGPLASGMLTGKYHLGADWAGRLGNAARYPDRRDMSGEDWKVVETLQSVAAEIDRPPAQVALAWLRSRPGVRSVIIGATRIEQLDGNLASLDLELSPAQVQRLTDAKAAPYGSPYRLF